jgi:hypothetical protein
VYRIHGSISANYIDIFGEGSRELGITGEFVYMQVCLLSRTRIDSR